MTAPPDTARLLAAVTGLRTELERTRLPLELGSAPAARIVRGELLHQLDDYLLPRLSALDAPLLAVVGGSTGAGKSTLVNSLVGSVVSRSGVIRPTTRASVLVHHPADEQWFRGDRILPDLVRLTGDTGGDEDQRAMRLVATAELPQGIALLDAPDVDSVVSANRNLSRQLLAAADLWLFVTTAARYADAVPWELLRACAERGTAVAIVLDRIAPDAVDEIRAHLASMLADQGLGDAPIFVVHEVALDPGRLLPVPEIQPLHAWLTKLGSDARARADVIRQTLQGALASLPERVGSVGYAADEQVAASGELWATAVTNYARAAEGVRVGLDDGTLLRGEVMARWHEIVGTGEFFRSIERGVGRARDRLAALLRGKSAPVPPEVDRLDGALQSGVAALLLAQAQGAAGQTGRDWRSLSGGLELLEADPALARSSPDIEERVRTDVRDWQAELLQLVHDQAGDKKAAARFLALGVNGAGAVAMIAVFSVTGGLTGAEIGIAGGSSVLAQRLLEAVIGEQAMRGLAKQAKQLLYDRADGVLEDERQRYADVLDRLELADDAGARLQAAITELEAAR
ncbi:dynamin family protein [Skermania piniformis]|uniref:ABC transporter n=1 Tax=Skermania pinensis TaxID=39122 RepID=A0ABX8S521_9ACTN|nr:dynamin family protein [Skermania piniformis]QXQ12551.1 ABC transporter [Skermania piniformis]